MALASATLSAQNPYMDTPCVTEGSRGLSLPNPRTVLAVDLVVEQEQVISGPYARYAQKFLGVLAPLADKVSWKVLSASVGLADPVEAVAAAAPASGEVQSMSHAVSEEGFPLMPIDRASSSVATLEESAAAASRMIYSLRHHRLELITGEAGEHVFGAGLKDALDEIARMEQGYLELFLGKRVVRRTTHRMLVYPQKDRKQYVVCRFNEQTGVLPETDLSGDMVLLQIEPEPIDRSMAASEKAKNVMVCRMAAYANCVVLVGARECGRKVLPVLEFGENILLPVYQTR